MKRKCLLMPKCMPRKFNRFTLFIQKFILLINTSTGIPIAAARFLEVQLKAET